MLTDPEATMQKSNLYPQVFAALSGTLSLISAGFHGGWASPSLVKLQSGESGVTVTSDQGSWIASFIGFGSIISAVIASCCVDRWGRKSSLLFTSVPTFIGCILIACAQSYWWYYVARFMVGLGIGAMWTILPMYLGEIAEDRVRGGIGILCDVMQNLGYVLAYSIGPWVSVPTLAVVASIFPVLLVLTFSWASESPYYYSMKNQPLKTKKSMIWLRGTQDVYADVRKVDETVQFDKQNSSNFTDLFLIGGNRKALLIVIGLLTAQQFSGIAALTAYSSMIYGEVISSVNSSISVIITGALQFVVSIGVIFLTDRVGRRPLLLVSLISCTFFLSIEAVYFHLRNGGVDVSGAAWISVAALLGYFIFFALGIGTVPIAMSSELFPCSVKALGITIGGIYLSGMAVLVTKLYQIVNDNFGIHIAFYIFVACSVLTSAFVYFVVPETKGRSLDDIQRDLRGLKK